MGLTSRESLFVAALTVSVWFSLRPDPRVESGLDLALVPTRILSELCAPVRWLRMREVRAAREQLLQREELEYAERRGLFEAERAAALPSDPALRSGRRFVHAEVVGRRDKHFDEIEVRLDGDDCAGLARGMPVTVGDVFVGRVVELDVPSTGRALVQLVTSGAFAVGARVAGTDVRCVVGGLLEARGARREALLLALQHPSSRDVPQAALQVDEELALLTPFAAQASGFALGRATQLDESLWGVAPAVDYRAGLSQLVIAAPDSLARAVPDSGADDLLDGGWTRARTISAGEPSYRREGREISAGRLAGVEAGAALVVGARLVGRVAHAGWSSSDVRHLADPGFSVQALARIEGRAIPVVLGRIVSLGHAASDVGDAIEFQWDAVVPLEAQAGERELAATLFTGSGEALVPRGLLLGTARLPVGPGPHLVRLRQGFDARALERVWARTPREERKP
ncbi:MAG: hypothetical protein IT454_08465 [Planctomycetes bacterium]|nr:hypothetical protein [Planctomycetota bacterium]